MILDTTLACARQLDEQDALKHFRQQFIIPSGAPKQVYFLGNSLGLQPVRTKEYLNEVLNTWAALGVEGFFRGEDPWLHYHDHLVSPLSKIAGALPHEVVVMNQLTVNLHLVLVSFYRPQGKRNKIICMGKAFPSDQYMLETHVRHYGFHPGEVIVEVSPRTGEHNIRTEDILQQIEQYKDELALVLWDGVNYYTGQVFDIKAITTAAHAAGAMAGFDLAHAMGNISLDLHNWNVDFACWCSYKYLNSGPGAISGAYIHERYHQDTNLHRFAGWWGYDKSTRFLMQKGFKPIPTAEGWQLSTPSLLLYAAHRASLSLFEEATWQKIEAKRKQMNEYLWYLLDHLNNHWPEPLFELLTPREAMGKSCQASLLMRKKGKLIFEELDKAGIMVDWREPDCIRLAPVPLYNTFDEIHHFITILQQILQHHVQV